MVVNLVRACPECNSDADVKCGQTERPDEILWYRSWSCSSCGFQLEEDGDETPEEIREILIATDKGWLLTISESSRSASSFKVLKGVIGLSLKDISKIRKDIDGVILKGTKIEVSFYLRKCREQGLVLDSSNNQKGQSRSILDPSE